jgi:hypothetical protein
MPAYRCPKHDIVFNSQEIDWQKAYEDCPICQVEYNALLQTFAGFLQEKEAGKKEELVVPPASKSRKQR